MKVFFFTDPHIGVKRSSHTTVRSQEMIRKFLFDEVTATLERVDEQALADDEHIPVICLGDLFDLYSNTEDVIAQGYRIAKECDYVLAGNHDLRNNTAKVSSLQLIKDMAEQGEKSLTTFVISPDPSKGYYEQAWLDKENKVDITFIPHCFTQQAFEESLHGAAEARDPDVFSILCLHCNVDELFGQSEGDSSTLTLTEELQDVVKDFSMVLVGHEHTPSKKKNIRVLGNFFPVTFGEIGDRFGYWFDTKTKKMTPELLYSEDDQYVKFDVHDMLESGGEINVYQRMVEITGEIDAKNYPDLSRALLTFWKFNEDALFAVRNSVSVIKANDASQRKEGSKKSLPEFVQSSTTDAGFKKEYDELMKEMGDASE